MKDEDFADGIYWILHAVNYDLGGGYDTSTGIDYKNDVFETWGFWGHCDCTCTYETREWDWSEQNPHGQDCYQSLIRELGFTYSWESEKANQDQINEEAIKQACSALGIDPSAPGSHVHCTCGNTERWIAWQEEATHDEDCSIRDYGFYHYESGLKVSWYKRVGRSTESSRGMKTLEWFRIVAECIESVRDKDYREVFNAPMEEWRPALGALRLTLTGDADKVDVVRAQHEVEQLTKVLNGVKDGI